jgi:hypothetical protein
VGVFVLMPAVGLGPNSAGVAVFGAGLTWVLIEQIPERADVPERPDHTKTSVTGTGAYRSSNLGRANPHQPGSSFPPPTSATNRHDPRTSQNRLERRDGSMSVPKRTIATLAEPMTSNGRMKTARYHCGASANG